MLNNRFTYALLITAALIFQSTVFAQNDEITEELVVPLSNPGERGHLTVNQIYGGVKVTGYSGKEVIVLAKQRSFNQKPVMKNGLRKINNNSMKLVIEETNNRIKVTSQHYSGNKPALNLEIKVPFDFDLKLSNVNDGDSHVIGVRGEMEISNINGSITLDDISGTVLADSVNGTVAATFESIYENSDMAFSSLNQDVDITLPKNVKVNIKAKTENGEILTGFDVAFERSPAVIEKESSKDTYKLKLEKWVQGAINGGGSEIQLKSLNGNILIRSAD